MLNKLKLKSQSIQLSLYWPLLHTAVPYTMPCRALAASYTDVTSFFVGMKIKRKRLSHRIIATAMLRSDV